MHRIEWDRSLKALKRVVNREALSLLVVLDTWVRNDDRFPPVDLARQRLGSWQPNYDNVFLTDEGQEGKDVRALGLDFGRAFTCGKVSGGYDS